MKLISVGKENKQDFVDSVKEPIVTLILYYADWCPHCTVIKPTWNELNKKYSRSKNVRLIEVEYDNMKHVPKKYSKHIRGFPTLNLVKDDKILTEYNGHRNLDSLKDFIGKYTSKKN